MLLLTTWLLLTLWTDKSYSGQPWYLGLDKIKILERRYLAIRPPNVFNWTPRSLLKNLPHFKASELRSFWLFYSLPCLWNLLEEEYFQHLLLLDDAVFLLLLQDSVSSRDIESSFQMLTHFCARMESLYGGRYETYNVQMLLHLPYCVECLGPLWCTSCFWFEGCNGDLTKLFHGTQNVDIQITHAVCTRQKIPELIPLLPGGSLAKAYFKHLAQGRALPNCRERIADKIHAIGCMRKFCLTGQAKKVVEDLLGPVLSAQKFNRLWKRGTMFHSVDYRPNGKRNSYTVEFLMNGHIEFGEVQYFFKCSLSCDNHSMCESSCQCKKSQHVAVLSLLERADHTFNHSKDRFSNATARHIIPIRKESGLSVAAAVADILCICVSVNICDASDVAFVCKLPNRFEKD